MDEPRTSHSEAGTDEEYFELLDARRRELARRKNNSVTHSAPSTAQSYDERPAESTKKRAKPPLTAHSMRPAATQSQKQRGEIPRQVQHAPTRAAHAVPQNHPSTATKPKTRTQVREPSHAPQTRRDIQRTVSSSAQVNAYRSAPAHHIDDARARAEAEQRRIEANRRRAEEERRRAADEERKRQIRRRIKEKKRAEFAARAAAVGENLLLFLIILMISASAVFSVMAIRLVTTSTDAGRDTRGFTYTVCGQSRRLDRDAVVANNVVYLDLTEIAELLEISISGTKAELIFETPSGESAVITPGSITATVNGNPVMLEGAARSDNETSHIWVPLSFVNDYLYGIDAKLEEVEQRGTKKLVITIDRVADPEAFGNVGAYLAPSFTLKADLTAERISISDAPDASLPPAAQASNYDFTAVLDEYERYMSPTLPERDEYLLEVNATHQLNYSYTPADLTAVSSSAARDPEDPPCLSLYAARALDALILEARASGYPELAVARGYVSYADASALFDSYLSTERNFSSLFYAATGKRFSDRAYAALGYDHINKNYILNNMYILSLADARQVVQSYCTEPGYDEHQSGLAADLCDTSPAAAAFADSRVYNWLCENAHKFGFIQRYPADKTEITGHAAEAWHFRYVGRYHAERIYNAGLCLEEYLISEAQ